MSTIEKMLEQWIPELKGSTSDSINETFSKMYKGKMRGFTNLGYMPDPSVTSSIQLIRHDETLRIFTLVYNSGIWSNGSCGPGYEVSPDSDKAIKEIVELEARVKALVDGIKGSLL